MRSSLVWFVWIWFRLGWCCIRFWFDGGLLLGLMVLALVWGWIWLCFVDGISWVLLVLVCCSGVFAMGLWFECASGGVLVVVFSRWVVWRVGLRCG